jgi:hypothetical protein
VDFTESVTAERPSRKVRRTPAQASPVRVDAPSLQALLDLGGPGGYVVLLGSAARHAEGLAGVMGGIHFIGINAPPDVAELPVLSLLESERVIPLRTGVARGVVVGAELAHTPWVAEAVRVLLARRRVVIESDQPTPPPGVARLASGNGVWVGEKR